MILMEKWKILTTLQNLRFGQNNCCPRLLKVAQIAINCPIWSHWIRPLVDLTKVTFACQIIHLYSPAFSSGIWSIHTSLEENVFSKQNRKNQQVWVNWIGPRFTKPKSLRRIGHCQRRGCQLAPTWKLKSTKIELHSLRAASILNKPVYIV